MNSSLPAAWAGGPITGATVADYAAFAWLFVCWVGYTYYADHARARGRTLLTALHEHRVVWMRRMLERDLRVADVSIVDAAIRVASLLATTTMFILAGLVTILGALDRARAVVSTLSFAVQASRELWEVKILLLVMIFVYAFFKFAWSLRQFNFALVMIGAAPLRDEVNDPDRATFPERAARLITRGVNTLNRGLRAYYFGLATLAWFIQPWMFAVACVWVVLVLYRREFRSVTLRTLIGPDTEAPKGG